MYDLFIKALILGLRIKSASNEKAKKLWQGQQGLVERIEREFTGETQACIWFHCASLGEFEQGRHLIETIKANYPSEKIVLTFFSPSGYEVRKNYPQADNVYYLPFDTKQNAERFIKAINPKLAVFVKYEFWYHYLHALHKKGVQTILISALFQPRHPFFKWYGGLHRKMLHFFDHLFVQDAASAALLKTIGISKLTIAGDTRLDRVLAIAAEQKAIENAALFKGDQKLLVAGSTWAEDERLLHAALPLLPKNIKMLLAPHEIHEAHLKEIENLFSSDVGRLSAPEKLKESRVAIADSMGQLAYMYRYADYVWVGGGFNKTGIHNALEPAVYEKPLFWGPIYDRYQEAKDLIREGAAMSLPTAESLAKQIVQLEKDPMAYKRMQDAAQSYVQQHRGATLLIMEYLTLENVF